MTLQNIFRRLSLLEQNKEILRKGLPVFDHSGNIIENSHTYTLYPKLGKCIMNIYASNQITEGTTAYCIDILKNFLSNEEKGKRICDGRQSVHGTVYSYLRVCAV